MSFDIEVEELDAVDGDHDDLSSEYDQPFEEIDFESLGINPAEPTHAKPGSEDKVLMLAARYAAGVPLWHDRDCYDHGPGAAPNPLLTNLA